MPAADHTPLLRTKIHPPRLDEGRVARPRLLESFCERRDCLLTLVAAPAGYGKSILVAEWTVASGRPSAWICFDESDNDLRVSARYLVAAVESMFPKSCPRTSSLIDAAELPSVRVLASQLANELDAIGEAFILVLDDYHEIHEPAIHDLLGELLHHPPLNVHWVITTRRDPPLPLASLRASGQMDEIRFDELRFSEAEAGQLMKGILGSSLSATGLNKVAEMTEGWVAGLQLLALACRHQPDPEGFLIGLKGSIRDIQDYLIAEVLSRETPEFRRCILKTSMVDRFSAGFCEGVCEKCDQCPLAGTGMIDKLADTDAFMVPLDAEGEWFRYHQLFRDLLRRQLEIELSPEEIVGLHSRASCWFEGLGLIEQAIGHALKAGDPIRAAEIVESHLHAELNADRWQQLDQWLRKIPKEVQQGRPKLLLGAACVAIERSRLPELPALVERMESLVDDDTAEPEVLGSLNLLRGELQYWQGNPGRSLELFREARGQIPSSQQFIAAENELHAGLALQALGRYDEAREKLEERMRDAGSSSRIYRSRLVAGQSFVNMLAGELPAAAEGARHLENIGTKGERAYVKLWGAYLQALAQFHWFELDEVVPRFAELAKNVYPMHSREAIDTLAGHALVREMSGQHTTAGAEVQKLREFAEESGNLELRNVAGSCEARIAVWRGDLEPALRWQRSYREPLDFPSMLFWLELPAVTECRVLIARGQQADLEEADVKLAAMREGFGKLHNTCQLIDVTALHTMALEKLGRREVALETLGKAVALAERGGWIRPFVEIGAPMAEMLSRLEPPDETAEFVRRLRAAFDRTKSAPARELAARTAPRQPLIEALTNRELDVLELIGKRLYDKEIADQLSISPGTVKSHLKHIYGKLDVGNRREAVVQAKALGII